MTSWHAYSLPSRRVAGMLKRVGGQGFRILRRSVFLAVNAVHLPALGQFSAAAVTARILGTVKDSSGAVLINTQVTASNDATHVAQSVHTNAQGVYTVAALPPGAYTIFV